MKRVFRSIAFVAILLMGISFILGACAPVRQTPAPMTTTQAPASTLTPVPASTQISSSTQIPAPTPASTPVLATAPTPKSTVFITRDLTLNPETVALGYSSTIGVTVTNTGKQPGTYPVVLKVNGDIIETQNVTLVGGVSRNVTFSYTMRSERDYEVVIDQLKGFLKVVCEVPG